MCGDKILDELTNKMPKEFWDNLIKMPIGWTPPPITVEDIAYDV